MATDCCRFFVNSKSHIFVIGLLLLRSTGFAHLPVRAPHASTPVDEIANVGHKLAVAASRQSTHLPVYSLPPYTPHLHTC